MHNAEIGDKGQYLTFTSSITRTIISKTATAITSVLHRDRQDQDPQERMSVPRNWLQEIRLISSLTRGRRGGGGDDPLVPQGMDTRPKCPCPLYMTVQRVEVKTWGGSFLFFTVITWLVHNSYLLSHISLLYRQMVDAPIRLVGESKHSPPTRKMSNIVHVAFPFWCSDDPSDKIVICHV